jgi:hypothetical protein
MCVFFTVVEAWEFRSVPPVLAGAAQLRVAVIAAVGIYNNCPLTAVSPLNSRLADRVINLVDPMWSLWSELHYFRVNDQRDVKNRLMTRCDFVLSWLVEGESNPRYKKTVPGGLTLAWLV